MTLKQTLYSIASILHCRHQWKKIRLKIAKKRWLKIGNIKESLSGTDDLVAIEFFKSIYERYLTLNRRHFSYFEWHFFPFAVISLNFKWMLGNCKNQSPETIQGGTKTNRVVSIIRYHFLRFEPIRMTFEALSFSPFPQIKSHLSLDFSFIFHSRII